VVKLIKGEPGTVMSALMLRPRHPQPLGISTSVARLRQQHTAPLRQPRRSKAVPAGQGPWFAWFYLPHIAERAALRAAERAQGWASWVARDDGTGEALEEKTKLVSKHGARLQICSSVRKTLQATRGDAEQTHLEGPVAVRDCRGKQGCGRGTDPGMPSWTGAAGLARNSPQERHRMCPMDKARGPGTLQLMISGPGEEISFLGNNLGIAVPTQGPAPGQPDPQCCVCPRHPAASARTAGKAAATGSIKPKCFLFQTIKRRCDTRGAERKPFAALSQLPSPRRLPRGVGSGTEPAHAPEGGWGNGKHRALRDAAALQVRAPRASRISWDRAPGHNPSWLREGHRHRQPGTGKAPVPGRGCSEQRVGTQRQPTVRPHAGPARAAQRGAEEPTAAPRSRSTTLIARASVSMCSPSGHNTQILTTA